MKQLLFLFCLGMSLVASAQKVNVTLQVDMTGVEVSPEGLHVAGDLNGWSTDSTELTLVGDNIYAVTVPLVPGRDIQYKFLNGNVWGTEEVPAFTCAVNGNNRIFTTPLEDVTLPPVPFNGCPATVDTKMVTFRVDMTGQTVDPNGVHVVGNFQGWSPNSTRMTDIGNNIYEVTAPVLSSVIVLQYKFINGSEWGKEEEPPEGCRNFDNNRAAVALGTEDIVLPTQTYAGCDSPIDTKEVTFQVDMTGFDVNPNGIHMVGNLQGWNPMGTTLTDIGNNIFEATVTVPVPVISIEYKFMNGNEWGLEEDPPEGCQNDGNNRWAHLELTTEAIAVPGVKFGSCDALTSLRDLVLDRDFTLAPSISSDVVSVRWELERAEDITLRVLSLSGQPLFEEKIPATTLFQNRTLEVQDWAPGMYLVYLQSRNAHSIRKLIVR